MVQAALQIDPPNDQESHPPLLMSREQFLGWDQGDLGGVKYEWKDGLAEVGGTWMQRSERPIVKKLLRRFAATSAYQRGDELFPEAEIFLKEINAYRTPDLSYFTREQSLAEGEEESVPAWVIEIISPNERTLRTENKVNEYLASGISVVWHIFPMVKKIRIFSAPNHVQDFTGEDVCSARPAVDEFEMKVSEIFLP